MFRVAYSKVMKINLLCKFTFRYLPVFLHFLKNINDILEFYNKKCIFKKLISHRQKKVKLFL